MRKKYIYICHTLDKFELPIAVADSPSELAEICGTTAGCVSSSISHELLDGKQRKYKRVEVIEDET